MGEYLLLLWLYKNGKVASGSVVGDEWYKNIYLPNLSTNQEIEFPFTFYATFEDGKNLVIDSIEDYLKRIRIIPLTPEEYQFIFNQVLYGSLGNFPFLPFPDEDQDNIDDWLHENIDDDDFLEGEDEEDEI
jgi:hypothetical protein